MFCFSPCRRCCCRPCPSPPIPTPIPTPTPIFRQPVLAAQFSSPAQTVAEGGTITLTTTTFTNAPAYITNNTTSLSLAGPGLYRIAYNAIISNTSGTTSVVSIVPTVSGITLAQGTTTTTIPTATTETLSGEFLVSVPQGTTSTITLTVSTTETVSVTPSVVVMKLS